MRVKFVAEHGSCIKLPEESMVQHIWKGSQPGLLYFRDFPLTHSIYQRKEQKLLLEITQQL